MVVAGCYRQAPPDPVLVARIEKLEARVASQEQQLAAARSDNSNSIELAAIATKLDELAAKIATLNTQGIGRPPPAPRRAPDPALTYAVPIAGSPTVGSPKAKVTIVMAFEFACPYCRKAWDTMDALQKKYGKDLRLVYKQFVVHPKNATRAAQASCAAWHQGKWRPLAELLWVKLFEARNFDDSNVDAIATEAGLDMRQYQADMSGSCVQEIADEQTLLKRFAVGATPSFFINGRFLAGALPQADFEALIDEEMRKATAVVKAGTKPEKLYDQEVLGKGAPEVPLP
jgi:protein-disulfide isomerase